MKISLKPKWLDKEPITPLHRLLKNIKPEYPHHWACSGNWWKPMGTPGCICLKSLQNSCREDTRKVPIIHYAL